VSVAQPGTLERDGPGTDQLQDRGPCRYLDPRRW
jgi:hypothetical protein